MNEIDFCPNCGRPKKGSYCPSCGFDSARTPIQLKSQPVSDPYERPFAPPPQYGPPIGVRIGASPLAKKGVALMVICIVAIILSLVIPWIIAEREVEENQKKSFAFNFNLDLVYGDEDDWGSDEYTSGDYKDHLKDTIGQSFLGLILALVLAIVLVVVGVQALSGKFTREGFHGGVAVVGALLIIPGVMVTVSSMNFLGFNVIEMHNKIAYEKLGWDVTTSSVYPAAYLMLIFGLIILVIGFLTMLREITVLSSNLQGESASQNPGIGRVDKLFADRSQKIALAVIIIAIIGLLTFPLFPWFGMEQEMTNWDTDEDVMVVDYSFGNSGILHIIAESSYAPDVYENLDGDVSIIAICFWLSLFLGIMALCGVIIYRTGRSPGSAHILLLIGAVVIIFAIIAMIFHGMFFVHLGELEDEYGHNKIIYGYNIAPLIMSICLLIASFYYLSRIVPYSRRALSPMAGYPGYGVPPPYPQYQQTPDYQQQYQQLYPQPYPQSSSQITLKPSNLPSQVRCPACKNVINVQVTSLPAPIKCPTCGTRGFIE